MKIMYNMHVMDNLYCIFQFQFIIIVVTLQEFNFLYLTFLWHPPLWPWLFHSSPLLVHEAMQGQFSRYWTASTWSFSNCWRVFPPQTSPSFIRALFLPPNFHWINESYMYIQTNKKKIHLVSETHKSRKTLLSSIYFKYLFLFSHIH